MIRNPDDKTRRALYESDVRLATMARLGLLLVLTLLAAASQAAGKQAILWEVRSGAAQPSFVFGTVHSEDPRVLSLPKPVRERFDQADAVVLELTLGPETINALTQAMYLSDGRTLEQLAGPELYRKTVTLLGEYGLPELALRHMKPWAAAVTLSIPKPKTGVVLDQQLHNQARQQGKTVYGLETAAEQVGYFDRLTMEEQVGLLRDSVEMYDELPELFSELIDAYLARDLDALVRLSERQLARDDSGTAERLMAGLVDERNKIMAERMAPLLADGNAFVAIGALHLPGENGVLSLLEQRGYELRPLY